jgi:hypothetical protein
VVGLLVGTASANVLIDNFEEGSVDIQAGPYLDSDQHPVVECVETGLSPLNTIGGRRWTSARGWSGDWSSVRLIGGKLRIRVDNDLGYDVAVRYDDLGGLALLGSGIAFDIDYDSPGSAEAAALVDLALCDTAGRSANMGIIAGQTFGWPPDVALSGTYEFVFDNQIRESLDLTSINSIKLSFESNYDTPPFEIDNIREVPEPVPLCLLTLACLPAIRRRTRLR